MRIIACILCHIIEL